MIYISIKLLKYIKLKKFKENIREYVYYLVLENAFIHTYAKNSK